MESKCLHKIQEITCQVLDKIFDRDNHDKPPYMFRRKFLCVWIPLSVAVYVSLFLIQQSPSSHILTIKTNPTDFLYINAGILATMMIVTLGVTLLGLQFRMQSYTMTGSIDYVNDKVVYGFIVMFIGNIMFSVITAIQPSFFPSPQSLTPFVITGTFFSLCYHAAYTYHVIYKLQPSQILNDTNQKMINAISSITKDVGKLRKNTKKISSRSSRLAYNIKNESFEIWKDVTKKAISTGDTDTFTDNLNIILGLVKKEKTLNDDINLAEFLSDYISDIMEYCLECNQQGSIRAFLMTINNDGIMEITDNDSQNRKYLRIVVLTILEQIMLNSINNNVLNVFTYNMNILIKIHKDLKTHDGKELKSITSFMIDCFCNVVESCITQNRYNFQIEFIRKIVDANILVTNTDNPDLQKLKMNALVLIGKMMRSAAENGRYDIFRYAMDVLIDVLNSALSTGSYHEKKEIKDYVAILISDVMKVCMDKNHHRLERTFLMYAGEQNLLLIKCDDSKIIREWRKTVLDTMGQVMYKAIINNDENFFVSGMAMMIKIISRSSEKSHDEISYIMVILSAQLLDLMRLCGEQNRYGMERVFIRHVKNMGLLIPDQNNLHILKWRMLILDILEQIMLNAVNDDIEYVFKEGMESMLQVIYQSMNKCTDNEKEAIVEKSSSHIVKIMKSCVNQNRHQQEKMFMKVVSDILLTNFQDPKITYKWKYDMSEILEYALRKAIDGEEEEIIVTCILTILKILQDDLEGWSDNDKLYIRSFICTTIIDIIKSCIGQNHHKSENTFIKMIANIDIMLMEYDNTQIRKDWRVLVLDVLNEIILRAINDDNQSMFSNSLVATLRIPEMITAKCSMDETDRLINFVSQNITNAVESCIGYNRNNLMRLLSMYMAKRDLPAANDSNLKINLKWEQTMWNIMTLIIHFAINTNNKNLVKDSKSAIFKIQNGIYINSKNKEQTRDSFVKYLESIKDHCNRNARTEFIEFFDINNSDETD